MDHHRLLAQVDRDLASYLDRIRRCVALLDEEQVWWRAHARSNSVGNLVLHLCGNLSQWVLAGVGGRAFDRKRSVEFTSDHAGSRTDLIERLEQVVTSCREVIEGLGEDDLAVSHEIQGYSTDGLRVVLHVWEHMSYHTGQVVLLTKQLLGETVEIDFYPQHRGE
jgi:uncharacterized damage-inducible protein DinB